MSEWTAWLTGDVQEAVERRQWLAAQEHRSAGALVWIGHVDVTWRQEPQQQQQWADGAVQARRWTSPNVQRTRTSVSLLLYKLPKNFFY